MNSRKKSGGKLYIVSISIGHPDDITVRAMNILKQADFIVGEEYNDTASFIKKLRIEKKNTSFK
jgi:16S rRNA (cytidine1402-2'-O)-methyltransferase